ncbi:MAG: DUF397 domain-containing protein [Campylobacterales bacterium]|nr:DUF397 domain-containing protein [Campylobacterales bacterium]
MLTMNDGFKKSHWCDDDSCGCGCVEVKQENDTIYVRSTYHQEKVVSFTLDEWRTFIKGAKEGEFDVLESAK